MSSLLGSYQTGQVSVLTGAGSVRTASGVCAPIPRKFLTDGASFRTGGESLKTATTPPACTEDCECVDFTFSNGPYTAVPTGMLGTTVQVVDLGSIDLSCFDPLASWRWSGSITFQSPSNWGPFFGQPGAIYIGNPAAAIGSQSPPLALADIRAPDNFNFQNNDPGPADALTTLNFGPFINLPGLHPAPGPAVPIKLAIITSSTKTTVITTASVHVCSGIE